MCLDIRLSLAAILEIGCFHFRDQDERFAAARNGDRVRNDLLLILSNQTYASVSSVEGKEALRTRCLDAIRTIVREMGGKADKVEALYFTSFVMQ